MTRRRCHARRKLGLWLGLAALTVQVLLPFLIAAEIRVISEDPFLFGGLDPALTCSHDSSGRPAAPKQQNHAACPLCAALAAGHAITFTAATVLPPPPQASRYMRATSAVALPVSRPQGSYSARGPPARA